MHHLQLVDGSVAGRLWRGAPWFRWLVVAFAGLLAACQQNPVSVDYNPDANFNKYQRYSWQDTSSGTGSDVEPLLAERVKSAVADVLAQRGFTETETGGDFQVRYFLASTARTSDNRSRGSVGVGGGGGNVGVGISLGFPFGGSKVERRLQLTLDLIDGGTGKLAWRATQEMALPTDDPQATTVRIRGAVEEMLGKFPPDRPDGG